MNRRMSLAVVVLGAAVVPTSTLAAGPALPVSDPGQPTFVTVEGARPLPSDHTIAHWYGQFTDPTSGTTYGYNMAGADPALQRDVTIPVDLIPVKGIFPAQGNYTLDGSTVISRLIASPIFTPADFSSTPWVTSAADSSGHVSVIAGGELSAGNDGVQFEDAIMRSQFDLVGTSYHLRLGQPNVLSPWVVNCSKAGGLLLQNPVGVVFGLCSNFPFDPPWGQWTLDPTHLVMFVGNNLFIGSIRGCCALGYHTSDRAEGRGWGQAGGQGGQFVQTWGYGTYLSPGLINPAIAPFESDITVFTHEIAEWADDPFASNKIEDYYSPLPPQDGCTDFLENGDPVDRIQFAVPGNTYDSGPGADGFWHSQDILNLPWFARESPNFTSQSTQTVSAEVGRYSFMGDLNPYAAFHQPAPSC